MMGLEAHLWVADILLVGCRTRWWQGVVGCTPACGPLGTHGHKVGDKNPSGALRGRYVACMQQ